MVHQLGFICRVGELDNLETYSSLMEECEKKGGHRACDSQEG
jgi:hypothetical protein